MRRQRSTVLKGGRGRLLDTHLHTEEMMMQPGELLGDSSCIELADARVNDHDSGHCRLLDAHLALNQVVLNKMFQNKRWNAESKLRSFIRYYFN